MFFNLSSLGEEMILYLVNREVISRFVTYLLGRESPIYNQFTSKMDNWDLTRPSPSNIENLLEMIYNIYTKSQTVVTASEDEPNVNIFPFLIFRS